MASAVAAQRPGLSFNGAAPGVPRQFGMAASAAALATPAALAVTGCAVRLQAATIAMPAGGIGAGLRALQAARQQLSARRMLPVLVQFTAPLTDADKAALRKAGCVIHGYVPDNALLVEAPADATDLLAAAPALQWLGEYKPAYKVSPRLRAALDERFRTSRPAPAGARAIPRGMPQAPVLVQGLRATATQEPVRITLQLFSAADLPETLAGVAQLGARITGVLDGGAWARITAELTRDSTPALAALAAVQWIEAYAPPVACNNVAVQPHLMNVTPVWNTNGLGLTGRGQIIGHADTGLDTGNLGTLHPDFTNRVTAFAWGNRASWSDPNGHGTHTAGSILGNGTALSNGLFKGVAYEARLVHQSVGDSSGALVGLTNLNALFTQARNAGARIHSDSWESPTFGAYTTLAADADTFAWNNQDMLLIFGSGNDTFDLNYDGVCDLGNVGAPAVGKNVLTVGASESDRPAGSGGYSADAYGADWRAVYYAVNPLHDDLFSTSFDGVHQGMAAFSNRGPAEDGRLKPDVIAPGTDIVSCRSHVPGASTFWGVYNNNYVFCGGTSMATPLTAGAVALLRQYLIERQVPAVTNPSAALLKATIINGARSLTPGQYGYDQYREIPAGPRPNMVEGWGQVDLANSLTNLVVYDGITLTTGAGTSFPIVVSATNRVCITAVWMDYPGTVGAAKQLVNDLDLLVITPAGQTNFPNGLTQPDRLNNVEGIDLASAAPGVYTIVLKGHNVPQGPQPCALVVRGAAVQPAVLAVESVTCTPDVVRPNVAPLINGFVTSNASGLASVTLNYRSNGGDWLPMPMALRRGIDAGGAYTAALPAQVEGTLVEFNVEALANDSASALSLRQNYTVKHYVVYVWSGGSATPPYDTWSNGFPTIQAAVDSPAVSNGWQVLVTNGTYAGTVNVTNGSTIYRQEIIVIKQLEILAPNGPAVTFLDNAYYNRCITLVDGVLDGFTIQRGWGWDTA
ncbi:MAG: S8 family serine peptidase, partial [bacterium]|nr:S8 family serine peptidase [bacterium]